MMDEFCTKSCQATPIEDSPQWLEDEGSDSLKTTMSLSCLRLNPHWGDGLLHADGHAEVWTDWNAMSKFSQYGWRCGTNEDTYSLRTLMGNWNQERYDLREIVKPQPLPSQLAHYFETTYAASYSRPPTSSPRRFQREPHCFPAHQPELDPPRYKATARSCYMLDYAAPQDSPPSGAASSPDLGPPNSRGSRAQRDCSSLAGMRVGL
ncbi:UPF0686 protein C11orf1 homolog isoform X1 [Ornithorhynchus anatinus]|nr:UPF0686 protein C11orf1 homolog isoform X1 [Ornithorhynchus anatinus]